MFSITEGNIKQGFDMDYIRFGSGNKALILLRGIEDGLKNVKGMGIPFAARFRKLAKDHTVYVLGRRNDLPEEYSTRDMAEDVYSAMKYLRIEKADVVGISMGGMIAQYLAIDHPECIDKLVLAVTASYKNMAIGTLSWLSYAENGDFASVIRDAVKLTYTKGYVLRNKVRFEMYAAYRPKDPQRFITMCHACAEHNTYDILDRIKCPVLIIGGGKDMIVSGDASREMRRRIPHSKLIMYKNLGHGLYEEAHDFADVIADFLIWG